MIRNVLGLFAGIGIATIFLLFGLALKVASILFLCTVVYFFLVAVGVAPPVDFFPFVPYV